VDGHAALRSGAATVSGHIMLAGKEAPVAFFRTGYGAWTGQRLPDGSYSALAIYLSSRQAPRTAAEFRNECRLWRRLAVWNDRMGEQIEHDLSGRRMTGPSYAGATSGRSGTPRGRCGRSMRTMRRDANVPTQFLRFGRSPDFVVDVWRVRAGS